MLSGVYLSKHADLLTHHPYRISRIASRYELEEADVREWLSYTRWCNDIETKPDVIDETTDILKELGLVYQNFQTESLFQK